ncbi:MAG: methylmalonyl-CoA mutase family protein [Planctomycetota bacterium]|nr:methylmalonyl-CoA mutase family protein [Planctomycetota bacterium]
MNSGSPNERRTSSDLELDPCYFAEAPRENEVPGEYPFTRGVYPSMYRGRLWTMRQYAGFSTPEESNRRYRYLLDHGQTGLSVAFDLPTQMGYDSDHPMAEGEVGKVGVAIDSLADMEVLFDGIPMAEVSTSMTINATAPILLCFYLAVAEAQGADLSRVSGTVQNDILKEYIARGTYIHPPRPSLRLVTDVFDFCGRVAPRWNTISISGYHIREAGSTAVQEVAFTLSNAVAYVKAALDRGLEVDRFGARLSFFFGAHNHLFEEVAKFRAARRMWARIMKERFGATNPKAWMLRFHTQTCGSTLTSIEPENNVSRVTLQALSSILGGTQSLHTNALDEALALPTEESARIALRTQQILGEESGVPDVVDPLGGSWYLEDLTDRLEKAAIVEMDRIEEMGGSIAAVENGYFKKAIYEKAYAEQKRIDRGDQVVVGVNRHRAPDAEVEPPLQPIDPGVRKRQIDRLEGVRGRRSEEEVARCLATLEEAVREPEANILDPMFECVKAYSTLGEISGCLERIWGRYREPSF